MSKISRLKDKRKQRESARSPLGINSPKTQVPADELLQRVFKII